MDKRKAKRIICAYLVAMLDDGNIDQFIIGESDNDDDDFDRLQEVKDEIRQEMQRRAGDER